MSCSVIGNQAGIQALAKLDWTDNGLPFVGIVLIQPGCRNPLYLLRDTKPTGDAPCQTVNLC
jgi:LSD1 subclass zinc finger protein